MSRAAQEVQRQINEMRKRRPQNRSPRVAAHETDVHETSDQSSPTDATDELATPQDTGAPTNQGGDVATARRAATRTRKRPARPSRASKAKTAKANRPTVKRASAARATSKPNGKWTGTGVPDPAKMRLARGGITAGDGSTMSLTFSNGYEVHAKVSGDDPVAVRDNLVAWMRKRLGADRA